MNSGRLDAVLKWCLSERVRVPAYSKAVRAAHKRSLKKYALRHPDRVKAREVRFRTKTMPCEVRGSMVNIHRHHHNYNKPLDVIFLCRQHHKDMHSWDNVRG